MERRDFLRAGVGVGGALGLGAEGCVNGLGIDALNPAALAGLDMGGFLTRLDASRSTIQTASSLASVLPKDTAARAAKDPRYARGEELIRKNMSSLLLIGSFGDLSEEARAHPGVQQRVWSATPDMNDSVIGTRDYLSALSPTERADISRALRKDPTLGPRILGALDDEAKKAGVPEHRREHLAGIGRFACFRLQQSTSAFVDEYDEKIQKTIARSGSAEEAERRLVAQMGEREFSTFHARQTALAEAWSRVPGAMQGATPPYPAPPPGYAPQPAYPPPPGVGQPPGYPPPQSVLGPDGQPIYGPAQEPKPKRGGGVLIAGAICMGLGVIALIVGLVLISNPATSIGGAFVLTQAALLGVAGIVCLIVGAVLRSD